MPTFEEIVSLVTKQAKKALKIGEVPVGAVLCSRDENSE